MCSGQSGSDLHRNSEDFGFNRNYVAVFDSVVREGIARGEIRDDLPLHLMRDLFYGALEHTVRTIMAREQAAPPREAEIEQLSQKIMAMVRPAYNLLPSLSPSTPAPDLHDITRRLENVVSRLEIVAS